MPAALNHYWGYALTRPALLPAPGATVAMYITGTLTLASLFEDAAGTIPLANPFVADVDSYYTAYTEEPILDIQFSGGGISPPYTLGYVTAGGGGSSAAVESLAWADFPAPTEAGQLVRLTDRWRDLWLATGTAWIGVNGRRFDVTEFGATGDGVTDDTQAIQDAIDAANLENGGEVYFPPGRYIVAPLNATAYCLTLAGDNVHLVGAGRGVSIVQLADNQGSFSRPLHVAGAAQCSVRSMTWDGNAANQVGVQEQQHLMFVNAATEFVTFDVHFIQPKGDALYWYAGSQRCLALGCYFEGGYRVAIHSQTFRNCAIHACVFWDNHGQCAIKAEMDNEGLEGDGLAITGNVITGDAGTGGIIISGYSPTTRAKNLAVAGNVIRGALVNGIMLGVYSSAWAITGNTIDGCVAGIVEGSYSVPYGYEGQRDIVISGNMIRNLTGTGPDDYAISVSNTTGLNVTGNSVVCTALARGIRLQHSTDVQCVGNNLLLGAASSVGILFNRTKVGQCVGNQIEFTGGGSNYGVFVADLAPYQAEQIYIASTNIKGLCDNAIRLNDVAVLGTVSVNGVWAPGATTLIQRPGVMGFPEQGYHAFGTKKWLTDTAAPATGTWAVGDIVINTAPAPSGNIGWVCTTAGTPGTWKTWGTIAP